VGVNEQLNKVVFSGSSGVADAVFLSLTFLADDDLDLFVILLQNALLLATVLKFLLV
jgi:hypothetical protein